MTKAAISAIEQQYARNTLRKLLPAGSKLSTVVIHVSRSGMMRSILVQRGEADGSVRDLSSEAARALGWSLHPTGGVKVDGCGMNMAFHLTYTLAHVLHGYGYALSNR